MSTKVKSHGNDVRNNYCAMISADIQTYRRADNRRGKHRAILGPAGACAWLVIKVDLGLER